MWLCEICCIRKNIGNKNPYLFVLPCTVHEKHNWMLLAAVWGREMHALDSTVRSLNLVLFSSITCVSGVCKIHFANWKRSLYVVKAEAAWNDYHSNMLSVIQINHQPDATIFEFIILTFIYSSTCFGRFPAHHQELNDCSGSLWLYLRTVVSVARPRKHHDCHHDTKVKLEPATAVIELLLMDGKTPETCWAVNKRQDNKLENCCILLVIYLNCTMMHGLLQTLNA
jgi:hypothetical protein